MTGPMRRFDPAELREPGEPVPSQAEQADLLIAARELETAATATDAIRPTEGFEDRVMAAIALEPAPRVVIRPGSAVRGGRPAASCLRSAMHGVSRPRRSALGCPRTSPRVPAARRHRRRHPHDGGGGRRRHFAADEPDTDAVRPARSVGRTDPVRDTEPDFAPTATPEATPTPKRPRRQKRPRRPKPTETPEHGATGTPAATDDHGGGSGSGGSGMAAAGVAAAGRAEATVEGAAVAEAAAEASQRWQWRKLAPAEPASAAVAEAAQAAAAQAAEAAATGGSGSGGGGGSTGGSNDGSGHG